MQDSLYSEGDTTNSLQDAGINDVSCSAIRCQDKEIVTCPHTGTRHVELSMREAWLLQLQPSDQE